MKKEKTIYGADCQPKSDKLMLSVTVALFFSFNMMFFGPLDFYLSNLESLYIPIKYVLIILIPASLAVFATEAVLCSLTSGKAHIIIISLIFGIGMAMYIQGNYLSINIGEFDGSRYAPGALKVIVNIVFWLVIMAVPFLIYRFNRPIFKAFVTYGSLFVFLIEVVTLITVFVGMCMNYEENHTGLNNMVGYAPTYICEKTDFFKYSSDKNYIIILTDSYDSFAFDESLIADPDSVWGFDGFTYYPNTLGSYPRTDSAIPYIFTGEKSDPVSIANFDLDAVYANEDLFKAVDKNYRMNLYTEPGMFPEKIYNYTNNFATSEITGKDIAQIGISLGRLTLFKHLPDAFKGFFQLHDSEIYNPERGYSIDDLDFYGDLQYDLEIVDEKCFKFIYLSGLHDPLNITADLERAEDWSVDAVEQAVAVNKIMSEYFEKLKENGVYDNSEIILLADHGIVTHERSKYPTIMIKRAGETSKGITINNAPISYDDVYPTLMYIAGEQTDRRTVFDIGEDEERVRYYLPTDEYITGSVK